MVKILIDFLGALIGISAILLFYGIFWVRKKSKWFVSIIGILLIAVIDANISTLLQSTVPLVIITILMMFALSLYFISSMSSKILFAFFILAILFATEQLVGTVFVNFVGTPMEQVQSSTTLYMIGVIASKLLALLLVLILHVIMRGYKGETDNQFNLIMAFMPVQSIIICFIVSIYSINAEEIQVSPLGITAILVSLLIVYLAMFLIRNQQKAFQYKSKHDLSQQRLNMQIEHYQKLYNSQREVRSIRHDINDTLIAISGLLSKNMISEAIDRINVVEDSIRKTIEIIDTGLPPIDAVINAKLAKAKESDIQLENKLLVDDKLLVDQFDIATLLANALDNAIEGIIGSADVDRNIKLDFIGTSDYISILVENYSTGPVYDDFRTSKPEVKNHGFGIEHMKEIVKKYNGDVHPDYNPETCKFTLEILLQNKPV